MNATTVRFKATFKSSRPRKATGAPPLPTAAALGEASAPAPSAGQDRPRRNVGRTARMLALAYKVESLVVAGEIPDYAEAARQLGITRARMTQVMDLICLAPTLQDAILAGRWVVTERRLRTVVLEPDWVRQHQVAGVPTG